MNKAIIILLVAVLLFSAAGCSLLKNNDGEESQTTSSPEGSLTEAPEGTAAGETSGSAETQAGGKTVSAVLYFPTEDNSAIKKETRDIQVMDGAILRACVLALLEGPGTEGLRKPIPEGTALLGVNLKDKVAIVDFSKEYATGGDLSEITERISIVNTLTGIQGVEKVRILVEGKDLVGPSGLPFGEMLPAALDANGAPIPGETKTITLYFGNSTAEKVAAEKREVVVNKGDAPEKTIILELIKGPVTKGLNPVIPRGTKLLSVKTQDGLCTVDFSKEFFDNHPGGTAGESMTLNSIVNSLTELETIRKVQFLIEGEKREVYLHVVFDKPFARNTGIIEK